MVLASLPPSCRSCSFYFFFAFTFSLLFSKPPASYSSLFGCSSSSSSFCTVVYLIPRSLVIPLLTCIRSDSTLSSFCFFFFSIFLCRSVSSSFVLCFLPLRRPPPFFSLLRPLLRRQSRSFPRPTVRLQKKIVMPPRFLLPVEDVLAASAALMDTKTVSHSHRVHSFVR